MMLMSLQEVQDQRPSGSECDPHAGGSAGGLNARRNTTVRYDRKCAPPVPEGVKVVLAELHAAGHLQYVLERDTVVCLSKMQQRAVPWA